MPDPITITGLSDTEVDNAGGRLFRIFGDFSGQLAKSYNVHFGPLGTVADPKGYSGKPMQGTALFIWNGRELRCYLPRLEAGTTISILVRRTDGTKEQLIPNALQVLPQQYYGAVFDLRAVLPPYYLVGPRNMENLEPIP